MTPISTDKAPAAIGPYSQAIEANGFVFTSGQIGLDPQTGALAGGGICEQTRQALDNLKAILEQAGLTTGSVLKTTVYICDMSDFSRVNDIYSDYFPLPAPARSCVAVASLPKGALVEIEAVAVKK